MQFYRLAPLPSCGGSKSDDRDMTGPLLFSPKIFSVEIKLDLQISFLDAHVLLVVMICECELVSFP